MSVDDDLATLRRATRFSNSQESLSLAWECKAALARVEAELSRLREQRDALKAECADWERGADEELARAWKERAEAAEARCARLQQALEWERDTHPISHGEGCVCPVCEALAGLDTPAYVNPFLVPNPGIPEVIWGDTPADSRPDHQDDYPLSADSRRCQCPVGSYDRGNAVHADYCPLADSQPEASGEAGTVTRSAGSEEPT